MECRYLGVCLQCAINTISNTIFKLKQLLMNSFVIIIQKFVKSNVYFKRMRKIGRLRKRR
ncbi:unnamed protein product [Paramecium sonneborni]|uniref:Uncharacterized protein n=1 Tax=Paramecium sonneborni TaxID=65129 RepID=A0A8S1Q015_9CILI|nr:unnamed protein product [Paramecium sonneborni]CAD8108720.1 unnamed protein product [Paramecium sonneborni]